MSNSLRDLASPESLQAEAIESVGALRALEPAWWKLWRGCGASPFQSPAWLLPWWDHIGQGHLTSLAWRTTDGELAGLAPLYVFTAADGRRQLFPLGIATTDRLDVLAHPRHRAAVAQALVEWIVERDDWDVFEAPQLAADALLLQLPWPRACHAERTPSEPNPVLPLPAALPPNIAQNLAYYRRRAAKAGAVTDELADGTTWPALLADLDRLHAQRWALRDQAGVLRADGVLAWHRAAVPRLLQHGLVRLLALRIDGHVIAVLYLLADGPHVDNRRWAYYIGGFDPAWSALSPGTLLVGRAIEMAQAEGCEVFDFLRGAEGYKARWGAVPQAMWRVSVRR